MATLFQYIDSICQKVPIDESPEQFDKDYSQFMVNKYFSCDRQLAPLSNLLNDGKITNKMHFDFMWSIVPKGKRWIKYNAKKQKADKDIEYLMRYYSCGLVTGRQYYRLISEDEMESIRSFYEDGGRKGKVTKKRKKKK